MKKKKQTMCPLFPDMICPQGEDAAGSCDTRMHADYDPMTDIKDLEFMHCAIFRARQEETTENKSK